MALLDQKMLKEICFVPLSLRGGGKALMARPLKKEHFFKTTFCLPFFYAIPCKNAGCVSMCLCVCVCDREREREK